MFCNRNGTERWGPLQKGAGVGRERYEKREVDTPPPIVDDSYRYSWPVTTIQRLYTLHYLLTPIKTRLKQALRMQGPCGLEEFNFQSYSPSNDDDGLKLTVY